MREIKFRGWYEKIKSRERWVYGYFASQVGDRCLINGDGECWTVNCDTVGQYTGVKDKNGKEVYEGDVVLFTNGNYGYVVKCAVIWSTDHNGWKLISNTGRPLFGLGDGSNIEILEK